MEPNNTGELIPFTKGETEADSTSKKKQSAGVYKFRRRSPVANMLLFVGISLLIAVVGTVSISTIAIYIANTQYKNGEYEQAREIFARYDFIPPVDNMKDACDYAAAEQLFIDEDYIAAHDLFQSVADYKDAAERADAALYAHAGELYDMGRYDEAIDIYIRLINYLQSTDCIDECTIAKGVLMYREGYYDQAIDLLSNYVGDYETADIYINLCRFQQTAELSEYTESIAEELYNNLEPYSYINEVAEALKAPLFFGHRFFGATWICGEYFFYYSQDDMLAAYTPWGEPILYDPELSPNDDRSAAMVYYFGFSDDGILDTDIRVHWFTIIGFDSYGKLHPDKVYILGNDGLYYVFERVDDFNLFDPTT